MDYTNTDSALVNLNIETIQNKQNKQNKKNKSLYLFCHSIQLGVSSVSLMLVFIICIMGIIELHNITHVIHSFNSNINEDISNVNEFLTIIPDLDKAVHMILQLCNVPEVEPFCNKTSYINN